jgi:type III restriction enzyme
VVQKAGGRAVNWILETKGRIWEDTKAKEIAMHDWCARVSEQTGQVWRHARVNQIDFNMKKPKTLAEAVGAVG